MSNQATRFQKAFPDVEEDIIVYYGDVSRDGYELITHVCSTEKMSKTAYLVLATYGGDPHAGYRIARCFRHYYGNFKILIPDHCKSAGTLIAIGASELIVADRGELGPLDIQLSKPDEMLENSSGMDLPQALDFLKQQTKATFSDLLLEMRVNRRLSTKIASDLASKLTSGMFHPIYAQIDPIKLGETSRANAIGFEYGKRLTAISKNMNNSNLVRLITSYPSHSFVIDRKEAADLFHQVRGPNQKEAEILNLLYSYGHPISNNRPVVYNLNRIEANNDQIPAPEPVIDSSGAVPDAVGNKQRPRNRKPRVGKAATPSN